MPEQGGAADDSSHPDIRRIDHRAAIPKRGFSRRLRAGGPFFQSELMSKQPFMPLFLGDLLASTATWEGEERALYVLLLAYQWTAGPLPTAADRIARMCQYEPATFARLWQCVGTKFVSRDGGLINLRLEEHRRKAKDVAKKRANAGAKGGANKKANVLAKAVAKDGEFATPFVEPSIPTHPNPTLRGLPGGRA